MKKLLSVITAASLFVATFSIATGTDVLKYDTGDGYYFEYENYLDGVKIKKCVADGKTKVTIPKEIEGKKIIAVETGFLGDHITTLKIEAELEELPEMAGYDHTTLLRVILNEGLKKLGDDAFSYCPNLKYVTLPESLEEMGIGCFSDCPKIVEIKIPDKVDKIADSAFRRCTSLTSVEWDMTASECGIYFAKETPWLENYAKENEWLALNDGDYLVQYIGNGKIVNVPDASNINDYACSEITCIEEVTAECNLPKGMFYGCTSLKKATINCDNIGESIFKGCTSLSDLDFSINMDYIPPSTFSGCSSLKEFEFSDKITAIGRGAFGGTGFENVVIPEHITVINNNAFGRCNNLKSIRFPETIEFMGNAVVTMCENLVSANIPDSVAHSVKDLYKDCKSLTDLDCSELTLEIYYSTYGTPWREKIEQDTEFFILDGTLIKYNGNDKNVVIPDNVKTISGDAFKKFKDIETVTIPSSVETIEMAAFYMTNLKEVTIPENVKKIETLAFGECYELEKVTIKGSCSVAENAFYNCFALKEKNIDSTVKLNSKAFAISGGITPEPTATPTPTASPTASPTPTPTTSPTPSAEPEKIIEVTTGESIEVKAGGEKVEFTDVNPFVDENNRTQMPIRVLGETLGFDVNWDGNDKTAILKAPGTLITIRIGENEILKNGEIIQMDTTAKVINDRTYIPLRSIAEAVGYTVEWK